MPQKFTYLEIPGSFECESDTPENGWIGEAGENASPFIRIPCRVIEGPQKGKSAVWRGWLTAKAFEKTIARISEIFDWNGSLADLQTGKTTLAGQRCNIETAFETYNGKEKLKIKWLNPPGGGDHAPKFMDPDKVRRLLDEMNDKAIEIAKATPKKAATPPAAPPAPAPDDDDVPF